MVEWERLDPITEVQEYLSWATVLDVFPGWGWTGISLGTCATAPLIAPVKYFVKVRSLGLSLRGPEPRLVVALQRPNGRLFIVQGERIALVGMWPGAAAEIIEV